MRILATILALSLTHFAHSSELNYVKTDSPRDTMETFYRAMADYHQGKREGNHKLKLRIHDAIRCLASSDESFLASNREKERAAVFLKEVIDRVILLDFEKNTRQLRGKTLAP